MKGRASLAKVELYGTSRQEGTISFMSQSITQDMAYRQPQIKLTEKYSVSRVSQRYNKNRSYAFTMNGSGKDYF